MERLSPGQVNRFEYGQSPVPQSLVQLYETEIFSGDEQVRALSALRPILSRIDTLSCPLDQKRVLLTCVYWVHAEPTVQVDQLATRLGIQPADVRKHISRITDSSVEQPQLESLYDQYSNAIEADEHKFVEDLICAGWRPYRIISFVDTMHAEHINDVKKKLIKEGRIASPDSRAA